MKKKRDLELYIHIPFCIRKCRYCDFLSGPSGEKERQEYVKSLCRKICSYRELAEAYRVVSIFVGGGTPSILTEEQICQIFAALREVFEVVDDAEITLEMNPGTVTEEKLKAYRRCGINRLSIGLQSTDDRELEALGRIHTYEDFLETYQMARTAGFQNLNVDLMSAIPHQTRESYRRTLKRIAELTPPPEHISAYSLIIEEGTPFYERYGAGEHAEELPGEEEERQMYQDTVEILKTYGYHRYEISNYAKPGYECRHNLGYWNRTEYLGIGTGAASLIRNCRFTESGLPEETRKEASEEEPYQGVSGAEDVQRLTLENQMEETMFLGLRMMKGVSVRAFEKTFGRTLESVYGSVIERLKAQNLVVQNGDYIRLTEHGIDISNYVMSEFLL